MNGIKIERRRESESKWGVKKVAEQMTEKMNSRLEVWSSPGLLTLLACSEQRSSLNKRLEERDSVWLHSHPPTPPLLERPGVK